MRGFTWHPGPGWPGRAGDGPGDSCHHALPVSDLVTPATMVDRLVKVPSLNATTVPLKLNNDNEMTPSTPLDLTNPFKDPFDILSLGRSSSCPPDSPLPTSPFWEP